MMLKYLLGLKPLVLRLPGGKNLMASAIPVAGGQDSDDEAELVQASPTVVDDLIVVVIRKRTPYDKHFSIDRNTSSSTTNTIIKRIYDENIKEYQYFDTTTQTYKDNTDADSVRKIAQLRAEKQKFVDNEYDYTGICADVFFKFVFDDAQTIREIGSAEQIAWKADTQKPGSSVQTTNADVVEQMKVHAECAMLLAYMIQFGDKAKEKYEEFTNEWNELTDDTEKGNSNYWHIIYNCNYNLWGEYVSGIGFHRGVDTLSLINKNVHAVCSGKIIEAAFAFVSIYNYYLDITITYLHLKHTKSALYNDWNAKEKKFLDTLESYQTLQSNPDMKEADRDALFAAYSGQWYDIPEEERPSSSDYSSLLRGLEVLFIIYERAAMTAEENLQVNAGEKLGTQSGRLGAVEHAFGETSDHTHFEVNKGVYLKGGENNGNGHNRPYKETYLPLDEFGEGKNFSFNPYPFIQTIWDGRFIPEEEVQGIVKYKDSDNPRTGSYNV